MNDERFQALVEKYLERTIGEDEARELLEAPEPWRSRLLDEVTLAGLLARTHGAAPAELAARVQAGLRAQPDKDAMVARVIGQLPAKKRSVRPFLALAAAALIAVALALVFRGTPVEPTKAPLPGSVALAPESKAAVAKALNYLRGSKLPFPTHQNPLPSDELVLLAFHSAGVPSDDPMFQKLLQKVLAAKLQRTYSVSLQAMVLERLDRRAYRDRLIDCAQFLVDNQCLNGQWSYGEPTGAPRVEPVKRTRDGPISGNNSCANFAAFGLRACVDAGVAVPAETFERAARAWRDSRLPELNPTQERSGWCYLRDESPHRPYASMTAGGLAALVVCDRLTGQDWRKDRAAQAGLNWLSGHFTASENFGPVEELMAKEMISDTPNPMTEFYYYLWALERAAAVCGLEKLDGHDWYAEGAHEILAAQRPDGSWYGGAKRCQPVWDTCFAILFLTRSTRAFGD